MSAISQEEPFIRRDRGAEISRLRLYLLRAGYLLLVAGLGSEIWPEIVLHAPATLMQGVVRAMLGALSLLAVLGLRYPLKMLPLLFFEMTWKTIWLIAIALPLWQAHAMDADTWQTAYACLMVVIFPVIVPWDYIFANFAKARGDRWR